MGSRTGKPRPPDPPKELMDAAEWAAKSNGWTHWRYLANGPTWFVQTEQGGLDGMELIRLHKDAIAEYAELQRRRQRRRNFRGWAFGFIGGGTGLVILGLVFHGC